MTTTTLTRQKSKRTLKTFFPIVSWLPKYKAAWLQPDTIAALTVWALLVPEASADTHIELLSQIAEMLRDPELIQGLRDAANSEAVFNKLLHWKSH